MTLVIVAACGGGAATDPQRDAAGAATPDAKPALPDTTVAVADAAAQVAPDGSFPAPDAKPPIRRYDVAYVSEFTFTPATIQSIVGFLVVVNTGTLPLDLSSATVLSVSDDSDAITWSLSKFADASDELVPGSAAGCLSELAAHALVDSGVLTEPGAGCPIFTRGLNFKMTFSSAMAVSVTYHAEAVIRIDGLDINVPFTIHLGDTKDGTVVTFDSASRIHTGP